MCYPRKIETSHSVQLLLSFNIPTSLSWTPVEFNLNWSPPLRQLSPTSATWSCPWLFIQISQPLLSVGLRQNKWEIPPMQWIPKRFLTFWFKLWATLLKLSSSIMISTKTNPQFLISRTWEEQKKPLHQTHYQVFIKYTITVVGGGGLSV